jgi:hypothetical protein
MLQNTLIHATTQHAVRGVHFMVIARLPIFTACMSFALQQAALDTVAFVPSLRYSCLVNVAVEAKAVVAGLGKARSSILHCLHSRGHVAANRSRHQCYEQMLCMALALYG